VCQANILQDDYFLSTLISWLTTLGSSMVRALRHTATYAALKIGRALVRPFRSTAPSTAPNHVPTVSVPICCCVNVVLFVVVVGSPLLHH